MKNTAVTVVLNITNVYSIKCKMCHKDGGFQKFSHKCISTRDEAILVSILVQIRTSSMDIGKINISMGL